jgi:hypothetical protein
MLQFGAVIPRKRHVISLNRSSYAATVIHYSSIVVVCETFEKQNSPLDYILLKNEECNPDTRSRFNSC